MRRLIIEEPASRSANWSRRLAWFTLAVLGLTIALVRLERIDLAAGLTLLLIGLGFALVTLLLALVGFSSVWRHGRQGVMRAGFGFVVGVALLVMPALMLAKGLVLPPINDVTTDLVDPPAFSRSQAALAARRGHVPPDRGPEVREKQREGYPWIAPVILDLEPREAFDVVRAVLTEQGLQVIEAVPPGGRTGNGRVEAIARTFIMRFPDDITIRIRPRADGSRIDIRSASRIGAYDYGANAERIRHLAEAIEAKALVD